MAQSWTLLSTQLIEDSDPIINANFETLQTSWAGTTYPTSPKGGQSFFHSTEKHWSLYNGAAWRKIFDATKAWGGLLPRAESVDYPMESHLYMGLFQIKNMLAGTADNDAVTLKQLRDDFIDAHYHSGADNDGPRVKWDQLDGHSGTANALLQIAYGGSTLAERKWATAESWSGQEAGAQADLVTVSCICNANETKYVFYGLHVHNDYGSAHTVGFDLTHWFGATPTTFMAERTISVNKRFYNDPDWLASWSSVSGCIPVTLTTAGTYSFRLRGRRITAGNNVFFRRLWLTIM